jgi:hypothetical protein
MKPWFPIRNMGMGLFASRKSAWLGFHDGLRGFGGEEWVIHERYRQAGRQTLCVTGFRWMHRFGDQEAPKPYPLKMYDRARNYYIAFKEMNIDTAELETQFVGRGYITADMWKSIQEGKVDEPCTTCGGGPKHATIAEWHESNIKTTGDINEHLVTMAAHAEGNIVVDCGDRQSVTVPAWLAGGAKQVLYVGNKFSGSDAAHGFAGGRLANVPGNSLTVPIEAFANCDVVLIDTEPHTGSHVFVELQRIAPHVQKYIMLHDTVSFGEKGQDGGPGVLAAARRFCRENPEWFVLRNDLNNNGFAVLSRLVEERKKLPRLGRQALNFLTAVVQHAASGAQRSSDELIEARRQACDLCEYRNGERCSQCGCYLAEKVTWKEQPCPLGRWPLDIVPTGPAYIPAVLVGYDLDGVFTRGVAPQPGDYAVYITGRKEDARERTMKGITSGHQVYFRPQDWGDDGDSIAAAKWKTKNIIELGVNVFYEDEVVQAEYIRKHSRCRVILVVDGVPTEKLNN